MKDDQPQDVISNPSLNIQHLSTVCWQRGELIRSGPSQNLQCHLHIKQKKIKNTQQVN